MHANWIDFYSIRVSSEINFFHTKTRKLLLVIRCTCRFFVVYTNTSTHTGVQFPPLKMSGKVVS